MNIRKQKGFRRILFIMFLNLIFLSVSAEERDPLWTVEHAFSKDEFNLKGPVYSMVEKTMIPIEKLGEIVRTDEKLKDSVIFDEHGKVMRRLQVIDNTKYESSYTYYPDSVAYLYNYVSDDKDGFKIKPTLYSIKYRRDSSGRIIEGRYFEKGELVAREEFNHTPTGYSYKPYGFSEGHFRNNSKRRFIKKGNDYSISGTLLTSGKLDSDGRIISIISEMPLLGKSSTYYKYNKNGDLVKVGSKDSMGNKVTGVVAQSESGTIYEYVYDDYGNWIEKRTCVNGMRASNYEIRIIIFKFRKFVNRHLADCTV